MLTCSECGKFLNTGEWPSMYIAVCPACWGDKPLPPPPSFGPDPDNKEAEEAAYAQRGLEIDWENKHIRKKED